MYEHRHHASITASSNTIGWLDYGNQEMSEKAICSQINSNSHHSFFIAHFICS